MADKNFKVKSGLNIPITSAAILNTDSNGNLSSTSTLAITNGGTGQTTAANALNALLPLQTGNTNYFLQTNGVTPQWTLMPPTSYQSTQPSSPVVGQLWVDSSSTSSPFDPGTYLTAASAVSIYATITNENNDVIASIMGAY